MQRVHTSWPDSLVYIRSIRKCMLLRLDSAAYFGFRNFRIYTFVCRSDLCNRDVAAVKQVDPAKIRIKCMNPQQQHQQQQHQQQQQQQQLGIYNTIFVLK